MNPILPYLTMLIIQEFNMIKKNIANNDVFKSLMTINDYIDSFLLIVLNVLLLCMCLSYDYAITHTCIIFGYLYWDKIFPIKIDLN